jgi:uncharacterized RmlC-like cupin family protein
MASVKVFRTQERAQMATVQTSGMHREEFVSTPESWVGTVRTEPGAASGWHHHGDYDTFIYMISGSMRVEFGADGKEISEAGPGDVVHVPNHIVHREVTPGLEGVVGFIVRVGTGAPVINVDGPDR